jgi:hypothetical protein
MYRAGWSNSMFTLHDLIWGIAVPALISALAGVAAWLLSRREQPGRPHFWIGTIALGAAFCAAFLGIVARKPIPPRESTDWLFITALGCTVLGLVDGLCAVPNWARRLIAALWLAAICAVLLRPLLQGETLSMSALVAWVVGAGLVLGAWWALLDAFSHVSRGPMLPLLLCIVSASVGMALLLSGSKLLGQLGGSIAVALGGWVLFAAFAVSISFARGPALTLVALIGSLLISAYFYAYLTWQNGALLAMAGLGAALSGALPPALRGWKRALVALALVLIPAGIAVGLAAKEFSEAM